ncbi:MAG: SRPBCC domain-containing protein [Myxococcota bacterium]
MMQPGDKSWPLLTVMLLSGCATVHTEVVIPAPPERVWSVLTNAQGYADWNPVMVSARGSHVEGTMVTYVVREPDGSENTIEARVERAAPEKELNQTGGVWGILTFDHQWLLEPVPGGTRVIQHEEYRGVGVWFWDESWIGPAYEGANEALRQHVLDMLDDGASGHSVSPSPPSKTK